MQIPQGSDELIIERIWPADSSEVIIIIRFFGNQSNSQRKTHSPRRKI